MLTDKIPEKWFNWWNYEAKDNVDMNSNSINNVSPVLDSATIVVAASDSKYPEKADYVCDGTDDHLTIESTISDLPSGGGKIVLLEGTYTLGASIDDQTQSDVTFEGQGWNTILEFTAGGVDEAMLSIGQNNWVVDNLKLDATNQTISGSNSGIYLSGNDCEVKGCYITQVDHGGIRVVGNSNSIHYNKIEQTEDDAIIVGGDKNIIDENFIDTTNDKNGIALVSAQQNSIRNNVIINVDNYGIALEDLGNEDCFDTNIIGNTIIEPGSCGIRFYDNSAGRANIVGNYIDSPSHHGISLGDATTNVNLTANFIYNAGERGINGGVGKLFIANNVILDSGTYSIYNFGGGGKIQIIGNRIVTSSTDETIYIRESSNSQGIISNNYINVQGGKAIFLYDSVTDYIISNNVLEGSAAIVTQSGCDYNLVIANNLRNGGSISLCGANSETPHNMT